MTTKWLTPYTGSDWHCVIHLQIYCHVTCIQKRSQLLCPPHIWNGSWWCFTLTNRLNCCLFFLQQVELPGSNMENHFKDDRPQEDVLVFAWVQLNLNARFLCRSGIVFNLITLNIRHIASEFGLWFGQMVGDRWIESCFRKIRSTVAAPRCDLLGIWCVRFRKSVMHSLLIKLWSNYPNLFDFNWSWILACCKFGTLHGFCLIF